MVTALWNEFESGGKCSWNRRAAWVRWWADTVQSTVVGYTEHHSSPPSNSEHDILVLGIQEPLSWLLCSNLVLSVGKSQRKALLMQKKIWLIGGSDFSINGQGRARHAILKPCTTVEARKLSSCVMFAPNTEAITLRHYNWNRKDTYCLLTLLMLSGPWAHGSIWKEIRLQNTSNE